MAYHPFDRRKPVLLFCRLALAFSWIYQGLVPKIVCRNPVEIGLLEPVVPVYRLACSMIVLMGYGELLFGAALLFFAWRWLYRLNIAALVLLVAYVAAVEPSLFFQPFNPATLSAALIALSLIALHELKDADAPVNPEKLTA